MISPYRCSVIYPASNCASYPWMVPRELAGEPSTRIALLGGSLLGQKKYADAEPLLREGYDGMKAREKTIPPQGKVRLTECLNAWFSSMKRRTRRRKPLNDGRNWRT